MSGIDPIDIEAARQAKEELRLMAPVPDMAELGRFARKVESIYAMCNCDAIAAAERMADGCRKDPVMEFAQEIFLASLQHIQNCKNALRKRAQERGEE